VKVVLIVQARMGSSRLPGKVLMPAAGAPMLAHQIDRLRKVRGADEIVVATSLEQGDSAIEAFCQTYGIKAVRGSESDVLSRFSAAAAASDADVIVRLTGDCPVIDPAIVDRAIESYFASQAARTYVSDTIDRSYPRGMDVEVFSRSLLDEADRCAVTRYDREHVTPFIRRSVGENVVAQNVAGQERLDGLRVTLDYPSDYANIKALIESGLPDYSLGSLMKRANELGLDLREADWQRDEHSSVLGRVGLGAAQFGMEYGRFNVHGMPTHEAVAAILDKASQYGLSAIDTAHLYGESEAALGRCGARLQAFEIITKTPRFEGAEIQAADARALRDAFDQSLRALRLPSADGLLIHHAPNLLAPGGERLYEAMLALKDKGLVQRIGVSVYSGEVAEEIQAKFPLDLVQMPLNVLDQRPLASGALARLAGAGVRVQVRSAFLQGLLLADPVTLGPHFDAAKPALAKFRATASASGLSPAHAALRFLLSIGDIDRIIVGVESVEQLNQLFASFPPAAPIDLSDCAIDEPTILNPALWPN
jgi:spore coat polysaccharide biosynthesis protein SpsF (cytidylyltransferase family)/aryl-alcohol dehydrogenase-like predicted oxidoreductase